MVVTVGLGDGTGALGCTCTGCAPFTEITRVIGVVFALIGTCGVATIITSDLAGSGQAVTDALVATFTA
jgi:hypothetical protein